MPRNKTLDLYATGMAIFAMFFGAGNIIFPLALGKQTLGQTPYAIIGLLITAVFVPFSGLLTMFLYQGEIKSFFGRLGPHVGLALATFIIALLGPLGSTPRCIALSFSTLQMSFPDILPAIFNFIACSCVLIIAYSKRHLLKILGYILTPLLLGLLIFIVIKGFGSQPLFEINLVQGEVVGSFWKGLKEGYNTMDLLAAFFFAPVIIQLTQAKIDGFKDDKNRLFFVLKASTIGAILLGIVYIGFCLLAARYAIELEDVPSEQLLAVISMQILGSHAGLIVCLAVVLACLTTAVALISAFCEFVHRELLGEKLSYSWILFFSIGLTYCVACFEFQGITQFLTPILEFCYPFLIVLTTYNFAEHFYRLKETSQAIEEVGVKT